MIRVGVIGTGEMGQHHVRIFSDMSDAELVGISDVNEERLSTISRRYGVEAFLDHKELLKHDLDAVSIAVPTTLHTKIAMDAMNKGIDVLVEKPIADTLENADLMIRRAEKEDLKLMVGHIERFNPAIIKLKELQKRLGKIVAISARRVGPYNPRIRDVGVIIDLGVHDIDVMSYLYSEEIKSVHAYAGSVMHKFEDYASILLGFKNGNSGSIETNWLTPHKVRKLTVTGTEGIAYVDYIEQALRIFNSENEKNIAIEKREPLKNELEHFLMCVKKNKEPLVGGEEGRHALMVALNAVRSYRTGRVIELFK
ncbi:MAG TPA: Gfo/Idh/MocA family oxidoreductase [Candidatus Altiarchaeales archaeon]|nr:Gfo/Idh/MocA family oxidoreductase [Candidatus Altiarchaeales archaeon]HEX54899.1 Gfo/Idh/MocA family oxidoreductase [Candidatus Altiarchaeales archaeon]